MKEVKEQATWIPARSIPGYRARTRKALGQKWAQHMRYDQNGRSVKNGCKDGWMVVSVSVGSTGGVWKEGLQEVTEDIPVLSFPENTQKTFCVLGSAGIQSDHILVQALISVVLLLYLS